jgi:hypothetical protein
LSSVLLYSPLIVPIVSSFFTISARHGRLVVSRRSSAYVALTENESVLSASAHDADRRRLRRRAVGGQLGTLLALYYSRLAAPRGATSCSSSSSCRS